MAPKVKLPPGHRPASDRRDQDCHGCGATDTHPRHLIANADGTTTVRHMDCCNCHVCVAHLDLAGEARGLALAAHLDEHADEHADAVAEAQDRHDAALALEAGS